MRKKVLAILPGIIPSTIIGIIKPLLELSRQGEIDFKVALTKTCRKSNVMWADSVVFCRNSELADLKFLVWAKQMNKQVIYEIDDNFFNISLETPLGRYHRHPARLSALKTFIQSSTVVHVYSNPMLEYAIQWNQGTKKIKSYFDFRLIDQMKKEDKEKIRLIYATSRVDNDELAVIFENALIRVIEKYAGQLEVFVWGEVSSNLKGRVINLPFVRDYNHFVELFYSKNFDIGIAPLKNDIFHRSKTNNKFREYGACEVAGIYSNVDVYSECISHKQDGMLVNNSEDEWFKALEELILNPFLREKIKKNAKEKVRTEYSLNSAIQTWRDSLSVAGSNNSPHIYNINDLRILIVIEREHETQLKRRYQALYEVLGMTSIEWISIYYDQISGDLTKNYDITIAFSENIDPIRQYSKALQESNHMILDIANVTKINASEIAKKLTKARIVTTEDNVNDNSVEKINCHYTIVAGIKDEDYLENVFVKTYGMTIYSWLIQNKMDIIKLGDNIKNLEKESEKQKERYYSLESPIGKWIALLLSYQGSGQQIKSKQIINLSKLKNKVKTRVNSFRSKYQRIKNISSTFIILTKINVFKKYK